MTVYQGLRVLQGLCTHSKTQMCQQPQKLGEGAADRQGPKAGSGKDTGRRVQRGPRWIVGRDADSNLRAKPVQQAPFCSTHICWRSRNWCVHFVAYTFGPLSPHMNRSFSVSVASQRGLSHQLVVQSGYFLFQLLCSFHNIYYGLFVCVSS